MLRIGRSIAASLLLTAVLGLQAQEEPYVPPAELHHHAQAAEEIDPLVLSARGRWRTLTAMVPINPVHVALMHTGKVLVVAGSGNVEGNDPMYGVWDPETRVMDRPLPVQWDMFCNGLIMLPDGRPFVFGGTVAYATNGRNWKGAKRAAVYRPVLDRFVNVPDMRRARWYPTGTVLGDGRVMVFSGNDDQGFITREVEIYRPTTNDWVSGGTAPWTPGWYPRQHLLPSGKVFVSGWQPRSQLYDPATRTWATGPMTILAKPRVYGTSVLLPLTPANGFKPTVMILGGNDGTNIQKTTEIIDLARDTPARWVWKAGPAMRQPRVQLNATLLPNGQVLVSGGSEKAGGGDPARIAELYDPVTNTFSDAAQAAVPRRYHSNTLLLPDATVLSVGDNTRNPYDARIEIYSPPYLFTRTGGPLLRPTIGSAPESVTYGSRFVVKTPAPSAIRSVVLIRAGAPTHAFDMEQRLVGLNFVAGPDLLTVDAPANPNLAPPGYYLLFILFETGTPSVGKFVRLTE